jgi:hypothetical protein
MAKGTVAKSEITKKLLETFEGSFPYDKEIRIPWVENGEQVEIKVTLTCAKTNVGNAATEVKSDIEPKETASGMITEDEKKEVVNLIEKLGL